MKFAKKHLVGAGALMLAAGMLTGCQSFSKSSLADELPEPQREFRGAWIATVANIDWPSKPGLSTDEQKAEALVLLDRAVELNMNAIVFQVRPHADALYQSDIEPWSYYLTGEQGKAPEPFYDPLEFWVAESHKRGLELHAWFNPYRAKHPVQKGEPAANSIIVTRPDLAKPLYPEKAPDCFYWMDPGEPEVQALSRNVMLDVAARYKVDGIHIDDYFYPYDSYLPEGADFPDNESWTRYQEAGGTLGRSDWRRKNVNDFVESFYAGLRQSGSDAQFGISPFGIWRPGYPEQIKGLDQYEALYADAKLWLNEGWLDYWTPQLYWPIDQEPQAYGVLLGWWVAQNLHDRHVWPGNAAHTVSARWDPQELINQVKLTREQWGATGNIFFSMAHFMPGSKADEKGLATMMKEQVYQQPALVPASPWLDNTPPPAPKLSMRGATGGISIRPGEGEAPFRYVTYVKQAGQWSYDIIPAGTGMAAFPPVRSRVAVEAYAVRAVDKRGNLSEPALLEAPKSTATRVGPPR